MILTKLLGRLLVGYFYFYLSLFLTDYSFILSSLHRKFNFPSVGISNISIPTLIFGLLFLLRWLGSRETFSNSPIIVNFKKIINLDDKVLLPLLSFLIFMALLVLSIARHISLSSCAFDLGIFDQAIWNTTQGNILFSSLKGNINLLGDHFEPILLLIAPLYKLWPNVTVLFILQSLLLASAVFPLYLIAKDRLKNKQIIYAFIISYILSKPLRGIGLSDFHPECFILPLLFWVYYLLIKKRNGLLFLTVSILLLCKEDVTFLICGFGIFTAFFLKRPKLGISLFILGISLWLIETKFIIPYFNPLGTYPYMNRLPFGLTYQGNLITIVRHPLTVVKFFFSQERFEYCLKIFGPQGFLSLLSPQQYILLVIPLLKNLIAPDNLSGFFKISSHYTAGLIPFVFISAIYAAGWLAVKINRKKSAHFIGLYIIFCSLMFYGKTDAYKFNRFLNTIKEKRTLERLSYLRLMPKDASVTTNFNLIPHLSHRKYIFEWNPQSKRSYATEYVVIDMSLLEDLSSEDISRIELYLTNIQKNGYKKNFENQDKTFFIFHNQNFDQREVEKIY